MNCNKVDEELGNLYKERAEFLGLGPILSDVHLNFENQYYYNLSIILNHLIPQELIEKLPKQSNYNNKIVYLNFTKEKVEYHCKNEVKKCSDGSYVRQVPPSCKFELCPNERSMHYFMLFQSWSLAFNLIVAMALLIIPSLTIIFVILIKNCRKKRYQLIEENFTEDIPKLDSYE